MDVATLITSFSTGTYTVTRRNRGSVVRGRAQAGTSATLTITASISPSTGADLKRLPEGRRTNEARTIFTTTQLYIGGQGDDYEADRVTIGGETYEVDHVETWKDPVTGSTGYRCVSTAMR